MCASATSSNCIISGLSNFADQTLPFLNFHSTKVIATKRGEELGDEANRIIYTSLINKVHIRKDKVFVLYRVEQLNKMYLLVGRYINTYTHKEAYRLRIANDICFTLHCNAREGTYDTS